MYLVLSQFFYDSVALIANLALSMIDACIILWISFNCRTLQAYSQLISVLHFERNKRWFACFSWDFDVHTKAIFATFKLMVSHEFELQQWSIQFIHE